MLRATSHSCSRSRRSAALALTLALVARAARADEGWRPLSTEDGIAVSERAAAGSALPDYRGQLEIAADAFEILALILDVPGHTAWMWKCRESRVLASENDSTKLVYQVLEAPWPAKDRDVVLRGEAHIDGPERVRVHFVSHEDADMPPVAGLVRMVRLDGEFELVALDPTHTRVTYTMAADPGGTLPLLFRRRTVRESLVDSLVGLRRRVSETRGRYADVAAIWRTRAAAAR